MPDAMIERILRARVYDVARESPLEPAPRLSARLGCDVLFKREDLQPVFSFKLRGAYAKIAGLPDDVAQRGVIAASAGNHAQGVALAASRRAIPAHIVMPITTPQIKVDAVRELGARVTLHGDAYDDAYARAMELQREEGSTFIPPFDDPDVIAGQGTIGMEILRQHGGRLDAVFVPVGGGGLIAGVAAWIKFVRPEVQVIGVEPEDAASLHAALRDGERTVLDRVGLFADAVAVKQVGAAPFEIAQRCVDAVVRVDTDEICAAILDIFEDTRVIAEPGGALAVAGLKRFLEEKGEATAAAAEDGERPCFAAIVSGANVNFHRLRHISERAELGEHREAIFGITLPEVPGSFRAFCGVLGDHAVTEFSYRYAAPGEAHVFLGVHLDDADDERAALLGQIQAAGYGCVDMTHNELAKVHARHMVGGRAAGVAGERLLRFEFPERPGALRTFLERMQADWNISLFHYRNHGAAIGRVLVGLQVGEGDDAAFGRFLDELGYPWIDETANPAYTLFLGEPGQSGD